MQGTVQTNVINKSKQVTITGVYSTSFSHIKLCLTISKELLNLLDNYKLTVENPPENTFIS